MTRITYGAPRLVDWVAQIQAGAAIVRVHFTGGALTSYGVTPAEYTTDCPFIQRVIEQSPYFKEGRIVKLRTTEICEAPKQRGSRKDLPQGHGPTHATPPGEEAAGKESHAEGKQQPSAELQAEDAAQTGKGPLEVNVSCLQDAQAYLQEHFNTPSYKVRSYDAAQQVAAEHGVRFVGAKFDALGGEDQEPTETEG